MKKLILLLTLVAVSFSAGESWKQTLLGYNNPNGRTGMITVHLPSKVTTEYGELKSTTTGFNAMLPLTDFVTIGFTQNKTEMTEVVATPLEYYKVERNNDLNFYFHIPLNKMLEGAFESY